MTSQIFGNLTAAFVLGEISQPAYFQIMAAISAFATFCFLFIRKPDRVARLDPKLDGLTLVDDSLDRTASTGTDYVE
jgi:phosphatidylglycerophosphatase A